MAEKETEGVIKESFENNLWMNPDGWEIPIDIEPPIEILQSFLAAVNGLLDFSLFVLDFIKAFVRNFLNPLLSIIKKIIALLKGIIQDLRQIGFYFTSDYLLFKESDNLLGGYQGFERRMLSRLTNEADPNRPNFSPQSLLFGLYLYGDSDAGDLSKLIRVIEELLELFGKKDREKPSPPTVTNLTAINVRVKNGLFDVSEGVEALEIKWQVVGSNGSFFNNLVGGFIIEISTELDGYFLAYDMERRNATFSTDKGGKRVRGLVREMDSETNVKMFGGGTFLKGLEDFFYEEGVTKDLELRLVKNMNSNVTISPDGFLDDKPARTYFVPIFDFSMDNSKEYSVKIKFDDLPQGYDLEQNSEFPREKVAIRIRTLDVASRDAIIKNLPESVEIDWVGEPRYYHGFWGKVIHYRIEGMVPEMDTVREDPPIKVYLCTKDKPIKASPPSEPTIVNVTTIQQEFRDICFYAVAQAILRGYDIEVPEKSIKISLSKNRKLINLLMPIVNVAVMGSSDSKRYKKNKNFGTRLKRDINQALDRAFEKVRCSPTLQEQIISTYENSTNSTGVDVLLYSDTAILKEEQTTEQKDNKEQANIKRLYGTMDALIRDTLKGKEERAKQGDEIEKILMTNDRYWAYDAPAYYTKLKDDNVTDMFASLSNSDLQFEELYAFPVSVALIDSLGETLDTTNASLLNHFEDDEALILTVLNLLFGSRMLDSQSDWSCFRLFPEGIPPVEDFFQGTINFLENIQETLEAFGKKILKAIAAIEEKIKRIQAIIAFIDRILQLLKGLKLDITIPLYALAHIAEGTDGLVTKLLGSGLKPQNDDPSRTHATGVLIVAGGLGTVELFEFLIGLLTAPDQQTTETIIIDAEEE